RMSHDEDSVWVRVAKRNIVECENLSRVRVHEVRARHELQRERCYPRYRDDQPAEGLRNNQHCVRPNLSTNLIGRNTMGAAMHILNLIANNDGSIAIDILSDKEIKAA